MVKALRRSLIGLGLGIVLLGSTATSGLAMPAAVPATDTPTVQATLHDNWTDMNLVPAHFRHEVASAPQYTLHVKGSGFVPGSFVKLALIYTPKVGVLHQGTVPVEPETVFNHTLRAAVQNPAAGTFEYEVALEVATQSSPPHLLVLSTSHIDIHNVTVQS